MTCPSLLRVDMPPFFGLAFAARVSMIAIYCVLYASASLAALSFTVRRPPPSSKLHAAGQHTRRAAHASIRVLSRPAAPRRPCRAPSPAASTISYSDNCRSSVACIPPAKQTTGRPSRSLTACFDIERRWVFAETSNLHMGCERIGTRWSTRSQRAIRRSRCSYLRQTCGRPGAGGGELRHLVSRAGDGDGQHRLRLALFVRRRVQQQLPLRLRLWQAT